MARSKDFGPATTIRLKADILARIKRIADHEGNTEAAVIRRLLVIGLAVIAEQDSAICERVGASGHHVARAV